MKRIFHDFAFSLRSQRTEYFLHTFIVLCVLLLSVRDATGQDHVWSQRFGDASINEASHSTSVWLKSPVRR